MAKTGKVNAGKIKQHTRAEINKMTIIRFCERHHIKSIKEYYIKFIKN